MTFSYKSSHLHGAENKIKKQTRLEEENLYVDLGYYNIALV